MKRKLRDRLDSIENALKELMRAVNALHPTQEQASNGHNHNEAERHAMPLQKPKAVNKGVKAARGKTKKQAKR